MPVAFIWLPSTSLKDKASGTLSTMSTVLLVPHWSVTVTVTVVSELISSPAGMFCVIVRASASVQLSLDIARTSPVRSGTMNVQSVEARVLSRSAVPISGAMSSMTVISIGIASAVHPLASTTWRLMLYVAPQVVVLASGAATEFVVVIASVVMSPVSASVNPADALQV